MTDHNRSPEEADDEQYYQYHLDRNGSPLANEQGDEVVNKNFIKPDVSGSALSDKQLRDMAKKVCNGHQHAMRYNNMLNACFKMGKMMLEELERQKADR